MMENEVFAVLDSIYFGKDEKDEKESSPRKPKGKAYFSLDLSEYKLKNDMDSMAAPFFALTPDREKGFKWVSRNGDSAFEIKEVSSSGYPTQKDKDVLIYIMSQLMELQNQGEEINPDLVCTVGLKPSDFMRITGREKAGGRDYKEIEKSLDRLRGAIFKTRKKREDGTFVIESHSFLSDYKIHGKQTQPTGKDKSSREIKTRLDYIEITLSPWCVDQLVRRNVLTIHDDYFKLTSPLDRRIYETLKKGFGDKYFYQIGLDVLQDRVDSSASPKEFKRMVKKAEKTDNIPEFKVIVAGNMVIAYCRGSLEGMKRAEMLADRAEKNKRRGSSC